MPPEPNPRRRLRHRLRRIYVLRKAGVPADDPALVKGIAWLKANQRESGGWFTRSLVRDDTHHYLSHIGSAFAVMAIQACE